MTLDPALAALVQELESGQDWPRPRCPSSSDEHHGHIAFEEPHNDEALDSERDHPAFDPEWIHGTFTVRGQCENARCQQVVVGVGNFRVGPADKSWAADDHDYGPPYSHYYRLTHVHPPIPLMTVPQAAPPEVVEGIERASRVLFTDPGLVATALRATVETFLTTQGVAATEEKNGKHRTLHTRLHEWQEPEKGSTPARRAVRRVGGRPRPNCPMGYVSE